MPTETLNLAAKPTPEVAAHVQLAAGVITEVVFTADPKPEPWESSAQAIAEVQIVVLAATSPLWFTVDGTDPVAGGRRSFVIPPVVSAASRRVTTYQPSRIKVLSAATATVSVQRVR